MRKPLRKYFKIVKLKNFTVFFPYFYSNAGRFNHGNFICMKILPVKLISYTHDIFRKATGRNNYQFYE